MHTDYYSLAISVGTTTSLQRREKKKNVQINRPHDQAVGFTLHGIKKKKKKDRNAQAGDERDLPIFYIIYVQLCAVLRKQRTPNHTTLLMNLYFLFFIGVGRPKSKLNISRCLHVNNISSLFSSAALSHPPPPCPGPGSVFPTSIKFVPLKNLISQRRAR